MDRVKQYREAIQALLKHYGNITSRYEEIERQIIFDREHDHYQLVNLGWDGEHRIYGCVIHLDIKDEKVWIQQNMTEIELIDELGKLGVPREDIVIGFHSPLRNVAPIKQSMSNTPN